MTRLYLQPDKPPPPLPPVTAASPPQPLKTVSALLSATASLLPSLAVPLLSSFNEKFGRSHLFSGSFAQAVSCGEGGGAALCFFLVYK